MSGVNAAWAATHPGAPPLISAGTDDDAVMWWLSEQSQAALPGLDPDRLQAVQIEGTRVLPGIRH